MNHLLLSPLEVLNLAYTISKCFLGAPVRALLGAAKKLQDVVLALQDLKLSVQNRALVSKGRRETLF